ncbi:MAG: aldo/keto reductase [Lachnospirales bacterium]
MYRKFGTTGFNVYPLGFGCMRFPTIMKEDNNIIDEKESIKMLRYAIDNGVNYIDTAYPYHGGESEILVGKALKDGYRNKVALATKSPVWLINELDDFDNLLDEQLKKLQTNYIDFYLLHALNKESFDKIMSLNILSKVKTAIDNGKIKYIGFSFHDKTEHFWPMLDAHPWDFVQLQANYLDEDYQAGISGVKEAAKRGMGVIIMEPLLGGKLANVPDSVNNIFKSHNNKSPVEWALDYLWNMEEVSLLLSGMSTMEQVRENISYANKSNIGMLSGEEEEIIASAKEAFNEIQNVPCTKCKYCIPCPFGVNIPANFTLYNESFMFGLYENNKKEYKKMLEKRESANVCSNCGLCTEHCPQHINIPEELKKVNKLFVTTGCLC